MSGKHTPGPWKLEESGWIEAGEEPVCMIHEGGVTNETEEADARLIAAAPEMLEALKIARADLASAFRQIVGSDEHSSTIKAIDAAIAKAEGEP